MTRRPAVFAIVAGGGIAATLDIAYALTFWFCYRGVAPTAVLHTIAGGLLGLPAARAGGASTALLGLGLHYFIAMGMAAAFFIVSRRFRFLTRRPIAAGIAYGVLLYLIMNFVVLPLSALPPHVWKPTLPALTDLCSHMFFVGLPIALATRMALGR
ncbi:MAG TPA: hypothetical protein VLK26_05525 [Rudaea sp.]|nr:hypothetical protein [Rudaea sp.]